MTALSSMSEPSDVSQMTDAHCSNCFCHPSDHWHLALDKHYYLCPIPVNEERGAAYRQWQQSNRLAALEAALVDVQKACERRLGEGRRYMGNSTEKARLWEGTLTYIANIARIAMTGKPILIDLPAVLYDIEDAPQLEDGR